MWQCNEFSRLSRPSTQMRNNPQHVLRPIFALEKLARRAVVPTKRMTKFCFILNNLEQICLIPYTEFFIPIVFNGNCLVLFIQRLNS